MLTQRRMLGCLVVLAVVMAVVIGLLLLMLVGVIPLPFVLPQGG